MLIVVRYCKPCLETDSTKNITFKPPVRKSSRKRPQRDYASLHAGLEVDPDKWTKFLDNKPIKDHSFPRLSGEQLTLDWLHSDANAFHEPIIIPAPEGLEMVMPPSDFEVRDVTRILGGKTPVEVIDVHSQSSVKDWDLEKWTGYYYTEPKFRDRIRNVISLEISDTELAAQVDPPRIVKQLDWVGNYWPSTKRGKGQVYPKVQLYCLMGVARAWTDWHVDFAGSSVYYHILRGAKTFYFIRPTPINLLAYEKWSGSETQNHVWLGDMVDEVFKVELHQGNTMIIPTGWIHAVHTPEDSLVFGGNFLHSYDVATQLRIREIEISTQVPKKFRFPMFIRLCWYVGEKVLQQLKAKEEFPTRVLESMLSLCNFLVSEVRSLEKKGSTNRESREAIPGEKIKDAPALARELRWRLRVALGVDSGDEARPRPKTTTVTNGINKRKRPSPDHEEAIGPAELEKFRHFKPRAWDAERRFPTSHEVLERQIGKEASEGFWLEWADNDSDSTPLEDGVTAKAQCTTDTLVRLHKFDRDGVRYVERHKSIQVREVWELPGASGATITAEAGAEA